MAKKEAMTTTTPTDPIQLVPLRTFDIRRGAGPVVAVLFLVELAAPPVAPISGHPRLRVVGGRATLLTVGLRPTSQNFEPPEPRDGLVLRPLSHGGRTDPEVAGQLSVTGETELLAERLL